MIRRKINQGSQVICEMGKVLYSGSQPHLNHKHFIKLQTLSLVWK